MNIVKNNHQEHSNKSPMGKDVIFAPQKRVLSFKEKIWKIELASKDVKKFFKKYRSRLIFALVIFIFAGGIFGYLLISRADVAYLYPTSCLGGWQNPQNAQGKPDLDKNAIPEEFNERNSAVLRNVISQIFCGGFQGEMPEDSRPKKAVVKFSWLIKTESEELNIEEPQSTSTLVQIIETTSTEETAPEILPEQTEELPASENENNETSTSTSFWQKIINFAFAEEILTPPPVNVNISTSDVDIFNSTSSLPEPLPEPSPEPESEISTSTPEENIPEENISEEISGETPTTTSPVSEQTKASLIETITETITNEATITEITTTTEATTITETPIPPEPFLEILYTLDGANWQSLGKVNLDNWQNFELEIPNFNWEDASKLQISIQSLSPVEFVPTVYLDGLWLEVEYEGITEEPPQLIEEEPEISQEFPGAAGSGQIFEEVFPLFIEGGWQEPENALNRDLPPSGFFEEFSYENSAHFNQKIAAEKRKEEKIIQETEENQEESQEIQGKPSEETTNQEISPELKNSLVFEGFSSPNVDKNFYRAYLRISLAARNTLENERLIIEYSLDNGGSWQKLTKIKIEGEISNQINGDYWSLPLNLISSWRDLNNLRIKVTYKNSLDLINDEVLVFLDNVWLEVLRSELFNPQQNLNSKPDEVIAESDGNDQEIFIINNSQRIQITDNDYDDRNPKINQEKDLICWESEIDNRWQIMIAEAPDWKVFQLSQPGITNLNCQVNEIQILWQAWLNDNWEIIMAERKLLGGWTIKRVTENNEPDLNPEFLKNKIIWEKSGGEKVEKEEGFFAKLKEIVF